MPLIGWTHATVAADLVDSPVDLHAMIIRVAEFNGNLTAGAAAALEIDLYVVGAQAITRANNLREGRNLEGEVVQLPVAGLSLCGADQSQTVMIRVTAQKNHASRHHLVRINVGNFEAENLSVKGGGSFQVAYLQDDMA